MGFEEQAQFIPGRAGLFVFGRGADGKTVERGTFSWEFAGGCEGPGLEWETLGWIEFMISASRARRPKATPSRRFVSSCCSL